MLRGSVEPAKLSRMYYLNRTLSSAAANLALDEALLLQAEEQDGPEVLRLWELPAPAVVLGAGCKLTDDVHEDACRRDGVPILRRASGGGTVLLGPGCLCFTLVLAIKRDPALQEILPSYDFICARLQSALSELLPEVAQAGVSDLATNSTKFSGSAQQRKRHFVLHHGTLLYDFNLQLVARYLRLPARQPHYRRQRDHADFLTNVPVSAAILHQRLCTAWNAYEELATWPEERVRQLTSMKYATDAWNRRRA
jgi:lipoate---protein ligase